MDIELIAGTTFEDKIISPVDDLTDYDAYMEVRSKLTDTASVLAIDSEAATDNGSILTLDVATNIVTISIAAKDTISFASFGKDLEYVWDMRFVHTDGTVFVAYPASKFLIKRVSTRIGKDIV